MVEERFYSVEELAKTLKVSTRTVRRWCQQGKLAHYEITDRVKRIPESVVDKLLAKSLKAKTKRLEL